jgi:hypothetical protein
MEATRHEPVSNQERICVNCLRNVPSAEPFRRGLCQSCYQAAHEATKSGDLTWTELEAKGIALPPTKGGRKKKREANTPLDRLLAEKEASRRSKPIKKAMRPRMLPAKNNNK